MKKIYFIVLLTISITVVKAQCNMTITALSPINICSGQSASLIGSGATTYTWSNNVGGATTNTIVFTPLTTTTVTLYGSTGACLDTVNFIINVSPTPTVAYTITPNMTPHVWDAYPTYSGGTPPYTYSWNWGDGSPNSTSGYPSHTYTSAAWYNICMTLTDSKGCVSTYCQYDTLYKSITTSTMVTINVINGVMGINQNIDIDNRVSIYPNPTSDQFVIDSNISDKLNLELYDVNGKHLFSQITSGKAIINTYNLNEGVYTLTIKTGASSVNKKLVILR